MKQNSVRTGMLAAVMVCLLLASCGSKPTEEKPEQMQSQITAEIQNVESAPDSPASAEESEPSVNTPTEASEYESDVIEKITGAADETGIYTIILTLSGKAAEKGVVEMVYRGPKGTPQENSVVNTFRIEYYKEESGTFEIHTFSDGEVYQNLHHQDKVKVNNTFSAAVRAGSVRITYTPDGGETQEIYTADAERFYVSAN